MINKIETKTKILVFKTFKEKSIFIITYKIIKNSMRI